MDKKDLLDGIKKAKLKKVTQTWQKYLEDKILLVGWLCGQFQLLGVMGERDWVKNICIYVYENDKEAYDEIGYKSLDVWIEECELGNDGFGFDKDELEILPVWYLDERICDCEDCDNEQTYREFIVETENEFGLNHEPIDKYTDQEFRKYLAFLDSLWDK